ncbi:unnamed protein product, partial [Coffea canephora]
TSSGCIATERCGLLISHFAISFRKKQVVIKKRRKEAFFSVLGRTPSQKTGSIEKIGASAGSGSVDAPAWAPLRDNYMLTNSKLKDWDKMPDTAAVDDFGLRPDADSSSDDE